MSYFLNLIYWDDNITAGNKWVPLYEICTCQFTELKTSTQEVVVDILCVEWCKITNKYCYQAHLLIIK